MTTSEFIALNLTSDPRSLALQSARYPDVDMPYALNQISGWQTARHKLPMLSECKDIVYPPHLSMEQCSSEATATYKRTIVEECLAAAKRRTDSDKLTTSMVDLTGGFGIDFIYLSAAFDKALYVERDEHLCDVVRHNLSVLGKHTCSVQCGTAETVLPQLPQQTMIYLDPARRDAHGGRTFAIADCTPDVSQMLCELMGKAMFVMLKLSPMLDWHKAICDLRGHVCQVHIVSVDGECKELLLVLSDTLPHEGDVVVRCVDLQSKSSDVSKSIAIDFSYALSATDHIDNVHSVVDNPSFLYEPCASIMKAGCFALLQSRYPVHTISANSHLFVSTQMVADFPGRRFAIDNASTFNRKALRQLLAGIDQANIAVRNFPMSVADLRKRLKLRDGGDVYIFATTQADGTHMLYVCHKV